MNRKLKYFLQVLVALCGIISIYFVLKPYRASHYLKKGQDLIDQKKFDEALQFLEKAVELDPVNPRVHYHLGQIYGMKGYFERVNASDEAPLQSQYYLKKSIQEFLKADKTLHDVGIQYNLGVAHELMGDYKQAFDYFKKAFQYDPQYQKIAEKLSEASERLGSKKDLEYAVKVDPENYSAYLKLGAMHFSSRNYKEAKNVYLKILEFSKWEDVIGYIEKERPQNAPSMYRNIVQMLLSLELDRYSESDKIFERILKALEISPSSVLSCLKESEEGKMEILETNWKKLIPVEFQDFLDSIDLSKMQKFFEEIGFSVYTHPHIIGSTGKISPVNIEVISSPERNKSMSSIKINGKERSANKRGFNGVILGGNTGKFKNRGSFDTYRSEDEAIKLAGFIENAEEGDIVVFSVKDRASNKLNKATYDAFELIGGCSLFKNEMSRWSYILIGIKGAKSGTAFEIASRNKLSRSVLKGYRVKNPTKFISSRDPNKCAVFISGLNPDAKITISRTLLK